MAAVIILSQDAKQAQALALKASMDAGGSAGSIDIYAGQIGNVGGSVKLATVFPPYPCGVASIGTLVFGIIGGGIAIENGIASWAQFKTSGGDPVADVNVSSTGGTAFLRLNTTSIIKDGPVTIESCTFEF